MNDTFPGHAGIEMTADQTFEKRVRRLVVISIIALGAICALSAGTLVTHPGINSALLAGWILMPALLGISLRIPRIRYLLAVPSIFVSSGLIGICLTAMPSDSMARTGWLSITVGILIGGMLGVWFWYRWLPVPRALDNPFSLGRWALIALHVSGVIVGLLLVLLAQMK